MQWKSYVAKLQKSGKLSSAIAVCDVSGSMNGEPMEVAIALSLLVSELAAEPYKGLLITFSEKPQLHEIKGSSLVEKVEDIKDMAWGMNTNLQVSRLGGVQVGGGGWHRLCWEVSRGSKCLLVVATVFSSGLKRVVMYHTCPDW
jgi:hypothetical protein